MEANYRVNLDGLLSKNSVKGKVKELVMYLRTGLGLLVEDCKG